MFQAQAQIKRILAEADVEINGSRPWDIHVFDQRLYPRVLGGGALGLGEAYMDGWCDAQALDQFFHRILLARLDKKIGLSWPLVTSRAKAFVMNLQSRSHSFENGTKHYDLGNDLFCAMLDKRLTYTCGYWKNANNLDEAQEAKLELVCRKIGLKKGDRILDIGCGWGNFLKLAAEKNQIEGVGITVSKEQVALGRELCKGLPIEIKMEDYRDMNWQFDHIVSLGMFEHVGVKNYRAYMAKVSRLLKDDGLFLLHTIGSNDSTIATDPWVAEYIFPNSMVPSIAQIGRSIEGIFVMEDWHNFGADYDKTLMAWFGNFDRNWPAIKANYPGYFYRMWKYYLLSCAGSSRARNIQLWQIVLSKKGVAGGYQSFR